MIRAIRVWAERHTSEKRYSPIGIIFHWTMAALVMFQLGWGWYMGRIPVGADKLQGYQVHSDIGLLMLVIAALRLLWRMIVPGPVNDADRLGWQTIAAHATHIVFYLCFFGLPLSGWAMWSALGDGAELAVAGAVPWPQMPFHDLERGLQWTILDWAEDIHLLLIILLSAMIPLHVGAALKHHFIDRHDVLEGMLPELSEDEPGASRHTATRRESRPETGGG